MLWRCQFNLTQVFFFRFTLYPAYSKVGKGNLVLRHSALHFLPNSGGIACVAKLNTELSTFWTQLNMSWAQTSNIQTPQDEKWIKNILLKQPHCQHFQYLPIQLVSRNKSTTKVYAKRFFLPKMRTSETQYLCNRDDKRNGFIAHHTREVNKG